MIRELNKERLLLCRKELGITQTEAAKLIGITQPAYQRYEAGTRIPSLQVLKEIASAFNTSVSYLTGESDLNEPEYITISRMDSPLLFSIIERCQKYDEKQLIRVLAYFESFKQV